MTNDKQRQPTRIKHPQIKKEFDIKSRGDYRGPTGSEKGGSIKTTTKPRKKPGPKTTTYEPNTDPSKLCNNPQEEQLCNLVSQKVIKYKAYQSAVNPKCRNKTASARASELCNRPDLARRIKFLEGSTNRLKMGRPPTDAPTATAYAAKQPPPAEPGVETLLITRAELNRKVSEAVRQAVTATEKTQAVKLAREMLHIDDDDGAPVDPVAVIQYLATAAGRTPQEITQHAGGLKHMLETVAEYAKAPRSTLRRVLAAWHRELGPKDTQEDTHTQDTQANEHLLPDGQSDNRDQSDTPDAIESTADGVGGGPRPHPLCYIDGLPPKL